MEPFPALCVVDGTPSGPGAGDVSFNVYCGGICVSLCLLLEGGERENCWMKVTPEGGKNTCLLWICDVLVNVMCGHLSGCV